MSRTARFGAFVLLAVAARASGSAAPPEAPTTVRFEDSQSLVWDPEPSAQRYNIYKGIHVVGTAWSYTHDCFALDVPDATTADPLPPARDRLVYYLVTQEDAQGHERPLGDGSDGTPRPPASPCTDIDGDAVSDGIDNCPSLPNPMQGDFDLDAVGDACDDDDDNDGLTDLEEAAAGTDPHDPDTDDDGLTDGDEVLLYGTDPLSGDTDRDAVADPTDNCPRTANPYQEDFDADGVGDVCDNCPGVPNWGQENADGDAFGDVCEYRLVRFVIASGGGHATGASAGIGLSSSGQTAAGSARSSAGARLLTGFVPRIP